MERFQKSSAGENYGSVGVIGCPLFPCVTVKRILLPILRLLLRVGNDICANFKCFIVQRTETLSSEEIEARNMSFLLELKCDESVVAFEDAKQEAIYVVQYRISLKATLRKRGHSRECKRF